MNAVSDARAQLSTDEMRQTGQSLFHDAMLLGKPRISMMVLLTVVIAMFASATVTIPAVLLINTLIGVALVASASSILNQAWERETDAVMQRTADRPVAQGRLSPAVGYFMGTLFCLLGTIYLAVFVNVLTAFLTLLTLIIYVGLYTPLKRYTAWNTLVGAVPGALPCIIGAAAVNHIDLNAWLLFAILFAWQFPHFFAISWIYRQDYANAGLVMLSTVDRKNGKTTGLWTIGTALMMTLICVIPFALGKCGYTYLFGSGLLSAYYLYTSFIFYVMPGRNEARNVLFASLYHLPGVFLLFLLGGS